MLGTAGGIGGMQLPVLGEAEAAAEDFSDKSDGSDWSDCSDESDWSDNSGFSGSAGISGTAGLQLQCRQTPAAGRFVPSCSFLDATHKLPKGR